MLSDANANANATGDDTATTSKLQLTSLVKSYDERTCRVGKDLKGLTISQNMVCPKVRRGLRIDGPSDCVNDASEKAERASVHAAHGIKVRDFAFESATPRLLANTCYCTKEMNKKYFQNIILEKNGLPPMQIRFRPYARYDFSLYTSAPPLRLLSPITSSLQNPIHVLKGRHKARGP